MAVCLDKPLRETRRTEGVSTWLDLGILSGSTPDELNQVGGMNLNLLGSTDRELDSASTVSLVGYTICSMYVWNI